MKKDSLTSFSAETVQEIGKKIKKLVEGGIQVAIVVGGGNIFRGKEESLGSSLDRCDADYIGMLATVMNGLVLQGVLADQKINSKVFSALPGLNTEFFNPKEAIKFLEDGHVVICVGGSGNPYFTTDTASVLRALELKCNVLMKATKVDGVYDQDPQKNSQAKRFEKLSYDDVMKMGLKVMDGTAITLASEHKLPLLVFSLLEKNCFESVLKKELRHTIIS